MKTTATTGAIKTRPTKKQLRRRVRVGLPAITRTRYDSNGKTHFGTIFDRPTYSRATGLRNGNGSKYDPVAEDVKHNPIF